MSAKPMTLKALMESDRDFRLPACETVGELIAVLADLPPDLPIQQGCDDGVKPVIFNQKTSPVLDFAENDGTWDDDDDEGEGE